LGEGGASLKGWGGWSGVGEMPFRRVKRRGRRKIPTNKLKGGGQVGADRSGVDFYILPGTGGNVVRLRWGKKASEKEVETNDNEGEGRAGAEDRREEKNGTGRVRGYRS